jgi:hypothetical protein
MAQKPKKLPDTFFAVSRGDIRGVVGLRREIGGAGAIKVQPLSTVVHDGDTIQSHLFGSGSLRFLGIDTAEIALNNSAMDSPKNQAKFADPAILDAAGIGIELKAHLLPKLGPDCALNHSRHAVQSQAALQAMVEADMAALAKDADSFQLFLAFSYEVFDGNGRFLCFVNRDEPEDSSDRPLSYNERLLESGATLPFFIWPNIAPFREAEVITDAIPRPGEAARIARKGKLGQARRFVQKARETAETTRTGVFNPDDPQVLEAFELRFLNRKERPTRGVIDLAKASDVILHPESYWKIPRPEDRLFIPPEFVPAFAARGWKLEGW